MKLLRKTSKIETEAWTLGTDWLLSGGGVGGTGWKKVKPLAKGRICITHRLDNSVVIAQGGGGLGGGGQRGKDGDSCNSVKNKVKKFLSTQWIAHTNGNEYSHSKKRKQRNQTKQ